MAAVDDLKAAGFSDEEIGAYVTDKAKTLTGAGFSTQEVSQYLGVAPAIQPAGQPKVAKGMGEAWTAGYQRSLAGMIDRSALPDVVIDAKENPFYERWASNLATMVHEGPESVAGAVLGAKGGGVAGAPLGPVGASAGAVIGGGAGAMYLPAVIREAYAKSIREGQITSKSDWLSRVKIALSNATTGEVQKQAGKEAAVGAILGGVSKVAGPAIGMVTASPAARVAGTLAAEVGTMAVAPAAIEGRLPEAHEFIDAATLVGGFKASTGVASKMLRVYEKTGKTPAEQLGDMAVDPSIRADLVRGTEGEAALRQEVKKQGIDVQEIDPATMDLSIFDTPDAAPAQPGRISTEAAWAAKDVDRNTSPSSTDLAALRADIEKNGVQKPITITVSTADGLAYVTDGNNRLAAARELGITDVPYKVELTDVPFTAEQKAKAKPTQELGLTEADLAPQAKSAEALAADDWLRRFNEGQDPGAQDRAYIGMPDTKVVDAQGKPLEVYHGTYSDFATFDKSALGVNTGARSAKGGFFFADDPQVASSYSSGNKVNEQTFKSELAKDKEYAAAQSKLGKVNNEIESASDYADSDVLDGLYAEASDLRAKIAATEERVAAQLEATAISEGANIRPVYLDIKNPLTVDQLGEPYREFSYSELVSKAKREGHDGLVIKNTFDYFGGEKGPAHNVYVAFSPDQIRSVFDAYEMPRAYQKQAAEMAAQEAFPGDKARQVLDTPMAEIPAAKLPHQLNLRYIEAPADVQALLTRMSEVYKPEIEAQRNGAKTWEQTAADAKAQLTDMLGADAKRIIEGRQGGDAVSTVELKIRSDLLMQATLDTSARLETLRKAGDAATPAERALALESVQKLAMIQAELTGAAAEAGRALQQMKAIKNLREQGSDIAKLYEIYGKDPDTMLKMLGDMTTPEQLSRLVQQATKPTGWQKFIEYYRASLMSGFLTVGYNVMGNASFLVQRNFLVEPAAALVGAITRSPDRVTATDLAARWYGSMYLAPMSMVRSAANAYKNDGVSGVGSAAWEAGQSVSPGPVLNTGAVGKFTKAVYGTNSMLDAMFRELTTQGELYSLATKDVMKQGHEPGTLEFFREVKALVENPTDAMLESAAKNADRSVFATPMGDLGKKFGAFADASKVGRFIVPFQQTPANIFKETFRNSPFAPLMSEWRADIAKGGATRDRAVAEMAVGTALWSAAVMLAANGKITGSGDPDPRKKAVQMQSGWQPYSYKTSDGQYIPLVRIAPTVGTMMGMAADVVQLEEYMTPEDQYKMGRAGMLTFKNAVTNQTMLAGITNVLKAMDDENSLARYLNSTAGSLVPASGMSGQLAALKDPYQREVYSMLDAVKMKVPGVRESLEPRVDAWGEMVPEVERPLFIAPVKITKQSEDKVRNEAARLGMSATKPPKTVDVGINTGRLGLVELTPEQRTKFAEEAGKLAYRIVEPTVNSALWDKTPDIIQRQIMQEALEAGRQYANSQVFTAEQLQQEISTRAQELRKRLQPK